MRRLCTLLSVMAAIQLAGRAAAENWPQWRGPKGDGTTNDSAPTEWGKDTNVKWRVELPERSNSTPVVWGDRVFVSQPLSDSQQRTLMCLDRASGDLLWQKGIVYTDQEATHETNPYCSPSPVTDGERVIVWHGSAGLYCYDFDGNEIWRRDLGKQDHMWGYGSSPIIHGDLCILNFGPGMRETLVAVDKRTGEPAWEVASLSLAAEDALSGPENNGRVDITRYDDKTTLATMLRGSWTTPLVLDVGGRAEMILTQARRVSAYDPASGKLLWVCGGLAPLAYTSPVPGENVIIAMGGYHGGSLAVRPGGDGDVTNTHRVWHTQDGPNWLSTGIVHEGFAYLAGMEGIMRCYDAATGQEKWERRLPPTGGSGEVWGSMTKSGDGLLYVMNQSGDAFVFRPSPDKYDQVARNSFGEATNSTPVISDGQLFLRTHEALWCVE